jgi:hypothetical protein
MVFLLVVLDELNSRNVDERKFNVARWRIDFEILYYLQHIMVDVSSGGAIYNDVAS